MKMMELNCEDLGGAYVAVIRTVADGITSVREFVRAPNRDLAEVHTFDMPEWEISFMIRIEVFKAMRKWVSHIKVNREWELHVAPMGLPGNTNPIGSEGIVKGITVWLKMSDGVIMSTWVEDFDEAGVLVPKVVDYWDLEDLRKYI